MRVCKGSSSADDNNGDSSAIVFLGDSLVAWGDWERLLPGRKVVNLGVPGETTAGLRARVDGLDRGIWRAPTILVMIGTNDLVAGDLEFLYQYRRLLETLEEKAPRATRIIHGLFPMELPHLADDAIVRTNRLLEKLACEHSARFLDPLPGFTSGAAGAPLFEPDNIHLTEAGYRAWARMLKSAF